MLKDDPCFGLTAEQRKMWEEMTKQPTIRIKDRLETKDQFKIARWAGLFKKITLIDGGVTC